MLDNMTTPYGETNELAAVSSAKLSAADLAGLQAILERSPRESGFDADRWSPRRIGLLLRRQFDLDYSPKHAVRILRRQGLSFSFKRAREPRLSSVDVTQLRALLKQPPAALGMNDDTWSRVQLAQLIETKFQVRYSPQYAARLIRTLGLKLAMTRRKRRLQRSQVLELKALLLASPEAAGVKGSHWSPSSITEIIFRRFGVRYHARSVSRVLRRWKIDPPAAPTVKYNAAFSPDALAELRAALVRTPQDAGLEGQIWTRRLIAVFLERRFGIRYSACTLDRLLARLNVQAAHRATRGGISRLNRAQGQKLAQSIHPNWTRKEVVRFIRQTFQIDYAPTSVPRLLRRLGIRSAAGVQQFKPSSQPAQSLPPG